MSFARHENTVDIPKAYDYQRLKTKAWYMFVWVVIVLTFPVLIAYVLIFFTVFIFNINIDWRDIFPSVLGFDLLLSPFEIASIYFGAELIKHIKNTKQLSIVLMFKYLRFVINNNRFVDRPPSGPAGQDWWWW